MRRRMFTYMLYKAWEGQPLCKGDPIAIIYI